MGDLRMGLYPDGCGFCLTVGQEIDDLVVIQIHQDGAEGSPTLEREILEREIIDLQSDRGWVE